MLNIGDGIAWHSQPETIIQRVWMRSRKEDRVKWLSADACIYSKSLGERRGVASRYEAQPDWYALNYAIVI